ncbi:MAG TPA: adenylate/guanylate cyclase domain-containing protein [Ramlibacter sp.]|uniref:adenylate/guanylate cyclase domain-containing protein n=1 Tax=Ramlibacter sp. TaxID=1917967 RepID=UPI002C4AE17E|nr:adenylate/guanylate cyclase domain-containing protein [Ramlibacter sp.]HVZ45644.1 adenylate/guanylate cyclase domain-containing protein [Ramlibacter sp.]
MNSTTADSSVRRHRILAVDDTPDNLFLIQALLEDRYEVVTAEDGAHALDEAAGEAPPDLILLDIMMPGMDGYEVLRRLRASPATSEIPVIFLTALASIEEEQFGLDLGAVDYITKPISPPVLLARVNTHLERSINARHLRSLSEKLGRYLAPQVVQSLFDGSREAQLHTQRKPLTVFFSDIKDFTASTTRWQPEEITFLLNSYFSEMSKIVAEHGGTLDKFIGDAMVVFFGDPSTRGVKEDALQCVRMAVAMQRRMAELQSLWRQMGSDKCFEIRCGINTGICDVGNFGSDYRMDYTIIGAEVNKAARLEQAAEPGGILISRETWVLVREEFAADQLAPVALKGFPEPVDAFVLRDDLHVEEGARKVFQWDRLGMRVLVDLDRLPAAERDLVAAHAAESRAKDHASRVH